MGRHVLCQVLQNEIGEIRNRRAWFDSNKMKQELLKLYSQPLQFQNSAQGIVEVPYIPLESYFIQKVSLHSLWRTTSTLDNLGSSVHVGLMHQKSTWNLLCPSNFDICFLGSWPLPMKDTQDLLTPRGLNSVMKLFARSQARHQSDLKCMVKEFHSNSLNLAGKQTAEGASAEPDPTGSENTWTNAKAFLVRWRRRYCSQSRDDRARFRCKQWFWGPIWVRPFLYWRAAKSSHCPYHLLYHQTWACILRSSAHDYIFIPIPM